MSEARHLRRYGLTVAIVAAMVAALLYAPLPEARAQVGTATLVPIQVTGPPSERLNLIIMGDGYTEEEMDKFRDDVDRNQNVQWSVEPFRSYRNYFNVYRLEIVSGESGIRCDPDEAGGPDNAKNTPLRLWYNVGCSDPLARGITYGPAPLGSPAGTPNGNAQRTMYLQEYVAPVLGIPANAQNLQTLAIANTFTYGGIGGVHATTSGGSPQGPLISLHELGHSLGNLQDEYPYRNRPDPGGPHGDFEPSSIHHTRMTAEEMIAAEAKWWRWLGEESDSGGIIGARDYPGASWESGLYLSSNVWRPSEHSIMRWIGFYFDQVGKEHMTGRITGRRNAGTMALGSTPTGEVGPDDVVWVETMHPKFHQLNVTWLVNGEEVPGTNNSRNLELAGLDVEEGDVISVWVQDPTDFVRDPVLKDGPRMTQTRSWTVGDPLPETEVEVGITLSTPDVRPVAGDEVVYVETTHPTDRVLDVTWELDGEVLPNPDNLRNLDLGALGLAEGTYQLSATVTDPADPGGDSDARSWTVDNTLPMAPRELSEPLVALPGEVEHNVYFGEFTMGLDPQDDQPGFVVGEFRLNGDGWFNYFGFPEQPHGTPFLFSHSGTDVKALTYGNLGSGGLSKATFEQSYPDFEPGYGTHTIEHRAIDAAGNIGEADSFQATVLPGEQMECTTTVTGRHLSPIVVSSGVTCLDEADLGGGITVLPGASLVTSGGIVRGVVDIDGAEVVHLSGTTFRGHTTIAGTTENLAVAGVTFNGPVSLTGNASGEYGVALAGNSFRGTLSCEGNSPGVDDFGAPNRVLGAKTGQCADL